MADLPRPYLIACVLAGLAVLAVVLRPDGGGAPARERPAAAAPIHIERAGGGRGARLVVHVAGAVRRPGVYRLRDGARVDDAVRRAGGAKPRADLSQLNLAAKLEDGRQVVVPLRAATPVAGPAAGAVAPTAEPVNLNTATAEQLDTLDGVGPVTVEKILQYRAEHGGFSTVDELGQIPGIGEKRLGALRERVTL